MCKYTILVLGDGFFLHLNLKKKEIIIPLTKNYSSEKLTGQAEIFTFTVHLPRVGLPFKFLGMFIMWRAQKEKRALLLHIVIFHNCYLHENGLNRWIFFCSPSTLQAQYAMTGNRKYVNSSLKLSKLFTKTDKWLQAFILAKLD